MDCILQLEVIMSENLFLARMVSAIAGAKVELLDSSSQLNQNETVSCEWFHKGCLATPGRMFKVAKDVAFPDAQVCDPYDGKLELVCKYLSSLLAITFQFV